MPRYIFNATNGIYFAPEFEVHHLPELETAPCAAYRIVRHFRACVPRNLRQENRTVEIVEETSQELAVLRLEAPF
ncbi:DUF6894 family protein [Microvirga sesbaniae]|jgi:hypothetical protein|uniref:DUF6894 family protein n=1 Tax=Microvirga sesbaniae TaxID=681392 RepID=UPI0021CA8BAD|nr:hypothetical protein [Microvirga sp. HBU67692]